jgi:hypothetical protein
VPIPAESGLAGAAPEIAKNVAMGIGPVRNWRLRWPRTTANSTDRGNEHVERHAFLALRSILRLRGVVAGADILEFGPGDNLASGFSLLAAGAHSYTALDRFGGSYASPNSKRWYRAVQEAWPAALPELPWPQWLRADSFPEAYPDRVKAISSSIEAATVLRRFDIVCSFQVGEHTSDVSRFASFTAQSLAPNGVAIHRVDFGPHDRWTRYEDPLTFLHFSQWLWSAMGSNRGYPNRVRHHEFLRALTDAGLKVECLDRNSYPSSQVRMDRLNKRFREMPIDSVLTSDVVYVCTLS